MPRLPTFQIALSGGADVGLNFGWRFREKLTGIWKHDTALANVPPEAIAEWEKDGQAVHLMPYAINGQPSTFTFRALTGFETRAVFGGGMNSAQWYYEACRIGVRFKDAPEEALSPEGHKVPCVSKGADGIFRLSPQFIDGTCDDEFINMYGALIMGASLPTEAEKKALSPQSGPSPSSAPANPVAAAGTVAPTEPAGQAA